MKERVNQIDVFYPFFAGVGRQIAAFYRYQLFEDGRELVMVPMLGKTFEGGFEARQEAHAEIAEAMSKITGLLYNWEESAMSTAWSGEERAYTLNG